MHQEGLRVLLERLRQSFNGICDTEQVKKIDASLNEFSESVQKVTGNLSLNLFTEEMENYLAEMKNSEKLSQSDFEAKYSYEINICRQLGNAGWVISEHSNPREVKEWYDILCAGECGKIVAYFEDENACVMADIIQGLEQKYDQRPAQRYFSKAKQFFEQEDYMTSAMYLVALLEARTNKLMAFPKNTSYSAKYSAKGFESHLQKEFGKAGDFFTKRFLFLDMYPSIIEFLNRLFSKRGVKTTAFRRYGLS
ncbi:MAG: hypothetical protein NC121_18775, partial [Blautia sp.]|nr:hypothetical protein [Blautia sp.]